mgnify:FL=1
MKKILKWAAIFFGVIIILGVISNALKSPEEKAADQAKIQKQQVEQSATKQEAAKKEALAMEEFTANDIAKSYNENTVAADQKFKDKKFKVIGTVADISTDLLGDPYVTLRGGVNQFMEPQFGFEKSDSAQLAKLKKGSKVTLICTGKGDVAKTPMSGSCSLL